MKTFEVWENIDYSGDSEKLHIAYIKAKNLENASKTALKRFLTKEQRKKALVVISDSDIESYDFETKFFNLNGDEITDKIVDYNEDTMSFEGHELVIEQKYYEDSV